MSKERPTLDPVLCELATAKEQHARMLDLAQLLRVLWHHHRSQTKPGASPVTASYHQALAQRLGAHLDGTPLEGSLQDLIDRRGS